MQDIIVLVLSQELLWLLCEMIKPDSFACRTNVFYIVMFRWFSMQHLSHSSFFMQQLHES